MKKLVFALFVVLTGIAGGITANADTIDFSQYGSEHSTHTSPLTGLTTDGVGVTLTSPNGQFTMLTEGSGWHGIFPTGAPILFDGVGAGAIELNFATGISSLTLAGQANAYGAYTETAYAYSGTTLVDTETASSFNHVGDNYPTYTGTVPFLTVTGTDITEVVWGATNDSVGLALYGGAGAPPTVPEPGTMMLLGLGMAGLAVYSKRRTQKRSLK